MEPNAGKHYWNSNHGFISQQNYQRGNACHKCCLKPFQKAQWFSAMGTKLGMRIPWINLLSSRQGPSFECVRWSRSKEVMRANDELLFLLPPPKRAWQQVWLRRRKVIHTKERRADSHGTPNLIEFDSHRMQPSHCWETCSMWHGKRLIRLLCQIHCLIENYQQLASR